TERGRAKQIAKNEEEGINLMGVLKSVQDRLKGAVVRVSRDNKRRAAKVAEERAAFQADNQRTPVEITKRIRQLEEKMYQHARDLEFEAAAQMRDEIQQLRERLVNL